MKLYNFTRLIRKYSVPFCLHRKQGDYVAGKWTESGEAKQEMRGAIVPMSDRKIYDSGGTYTTQDRELYLTKRLECDLSEYQVEYNGNTYTVEEQQNFEDYADVAVYALKAVSKHD